jgi:hypothetical protein
VGKLATLVHQTHTGKTRQPRARDVATPFVFLTEKNTYLEQSAFVMNKPVILE